MRYLGMETDLGLPFQKKRKTGERKIVIHKRKEKEDFREREKESFMIFQKKKRVLKSNGLD